MFTRLTFFNSYATVAALGPLKEKLLDEEFFKTCNVKIADLGNACWVDKHFAAVIQTRQYRSLEAILGNSYDQSADIWSVAALTFELATGDYLFDPHSGRHFDRNEDHIAMIIELLGPIPRQIVLNSPHARSYFNQDGSLRNIKRLKMWPLQDVLMQKYKMHRDSAKMMTAFLLPMLRYEPLFRATASECARHAFLKVTDEDKHEVRASTVPLNSHDTRYTMQTIYIEVLPAAPANPFDHDER